MGGDLTASIPKEKYSSHSQSGGVNKPVAQVEKDGPWRQSIPTHKGSITKLDTGERTRKSHSLTILTAFDTL
jgi:hypothetical protein